VLYDPGAWNADYRRNEVWRVSRGPLLPRPGVAGFRASH